MAVNTPKKHLFAKEYIIDLNASKAAIRAGYSEKTAYSMGQRLLKDVEIQKEIQRLMDERGKRTEITADRVLIEIGRIAFFNPKNLFNSDGTPKTMQDISDDTAAAISGLDVVSMSGGEAQAGQILKYKIADKNSALEKLCKHLGLFNEKSSNEDKPEPKQIVFTVVDARA